MSPSSLLPAAGPGARIAIAVQTPQIGRLLAMTLRLEGFEPHLLADGAQALDELLREPYAAAILDAHLVPVDGLTVCQRVRAATSTPVILLLMRDEVAEQSRAYFARANAVLFLPFTIDEVLTCVASVLPGNDFTDESPYVVGSGQLDDTMPRVLLALAAPSKRASLRVVLEDAGYPVLEAADGLETFDALLLSSTPLVVVLDLLLPALSGYEVLLRASDDPLLIARYAFALVSPGKQSRTFDDGFSALLARHAVPVLQSPIAVEQVLDVVGHLWARLAPPAQGQAASEEPV